MNENVDAYCDFFLLLHGMCKNADTCYVFC